MQTVRDAIKALVETLEVEGDGFRYNQPNDYGVVTLQLFTGEGDPFKRFAGEQCTSQFVGRGVQPNGRWKLNEAFVDWLVDQVSK